MSVVNEKQVAGAVELKEGTTVDILTGQYKGRGAIYKATILKTCGDTNCDVWYVIKTENGIGHLHATVSWAYFLQWNKSISKLKVSGLF